MSDPEAAEFLAEHNLEQTPNDVQAAPPNSIAEWVIALFDELHDPRALEVVLRPYRAIPISYSASPNHVIESLQSVS
jgi:hypothetical protein